MVPRCPFESYALGRQAGHEPWDEVLLETDHFVVVPTRGAIVEGWVLVVPRVFALSFGRLSPQARRDVDAVVGVVSRAVERAYGRVAAFEHGPSQPGLTVGCSVDYAHLHVLPAPTGLRAGADALCPGIEWVARGGVRNAEGVADAPYLYCEQDGQAWFGKHPEIPSQLFRRVVASAVGQPGRYDWRRDPRPEAARATADALRDVLQEEAEWAGLAVPAA